MGILVDVVIAEEAEAGALAQHEAPLQRWRGTEVKGLDPVKVGTLLGIVCEEPVDDDLADEFAPLAEGSEDGPWVFAIPERLVDALAELPAAAVTGVARVWAGTDELRADRWSKGSAEQVVAKLSALAADARREGKQLLAWMSV